MRDLAFKLDCIASDHYCQRPKAMQNLSEPTRALLATAIRAARMLEFHRRQEPDMAKVEPYFDADGKERRFDKIFDVPPDIGIYRTGDDIPLLENHRGIDCNFWISTRHLSLEALIREHGRLDG